MRYADALAYLDDHASYEKTGRITSPSLEPITRLTQAMGEPQHACPVIHVTGTNGKGSTVQMITRLLMAQGLTVGTYTSPHLERVNERLCRNGEPIDDDDFAEQVAAIADLEALIGVRPTYFETMTASAFRWFADIAVDVAVVEVGLLGRWDATNVVEAQVAVITNIGMDHNEFAGPTLADIATEKAGIIKPMSAAVIGETRPELVDIFEAAGAASLFARGEHFETVDNSLAVGGRLLELRTPTTIYPDLYLPLHGRHQGDNAAVALTAVETFFASPLATDVVEEAFANVSVPGRFEVIGAQPLVIVDGAHNPAGADSCAQVFFDDFQPDGRRILVIGTLRDPAAMLAALRADEFDVVIACTAPSPRGVDVADVARAARELGCDTVFTAETVERACALALRTADIDDAILVTGSLYLVGDARAALRRLAQQ
ncbi:MAG TPA: folylpolyglutamate synthase/dihydrofolate synthase family protein [Ilumatobacteraceae bacterium]|nr:folylpolyglutamate synthase/dihydrofolate synthase family protein [Ilumatobacteraceae bacterium]